MKVVLREVISIFAVTLFLFGVLFAVIHYAQAITPELSTTSNISNGALGPIILVAGTNLSTDLKKQVIETIS